MQRFLNENPSDRKKWTLGAAMIHYSTDYVFDGSKNGAYGEDDEPCPTNEYGRTKLAGEIAVQAAGIKHLFLRTSWVYGMHGKNFLQTILKLAQERDELKVVNEPLGTPTWSRRIVDVTANLISQATHSPDTEAWWQKHSGLFPCNVAEIHKLACICRGIAWECRVAREN